jgi:hypothetical protein
MKILLIGEFSGVHNNLKKGLIALGHDVKLAADGDGYRKFGYDIAISPYKGRFWGKIWNLIHFLIHLKYFFGYDVIQFINPFSIPYYFHFIGITFLIFKFNKKKIYYACGTDPAFLSSRDKFEYFPFSDINSTEIPKYNRLKLSYYSWFIRNISCIIPSMYTYGVGYFGNPKLKEPIPLPDSGNYSKSVFENKTDKIKILFGITRKEFKGADFIQKALKKLSEKYSEKVEVKIVEKLPFNEYIKILSQTDILIDQCKSYDYGMNAIFALEKGIIVLSGAESVAIKYLNVQNCPVINIKPDSEDIFNKLEVLVNSDEIIKLKETSLDYARTVHDRNLIAQKFLKEYANN